MKTSVVDYSNKGFQKYIDMFSKVNMTLSIQVYGLKGRPVHFQMQSHCKTAKGYCTDHKLSLIYCKQMHVLSMILERCLT